MIAPEPARAVVFAKGFAVHTALPLIRDLVAPAFAPRGQTRPDGQVPSVVAVLRVRQYSDLPAATWHELERLPELVQVFLLTDSVDRAPTPKQWEMLKCDVLAAGALRTSVPDTGNREIFLIGPRGWCSDQHDELRRRSGRQRRPLARRRRIHREQPAWDQPPATSPFAEQLHDTLKSRGMANAAAVADASRRLCGGAPHVDALARER